MLARTIRKYSQAQWHGQYDDINVQFLWYSLDVG